jgi:hypothetical protein
MLLRQRPSDRAQAICRAYIALAGSGLASQDFARRMLITRSCPKDLFWNKACKQATRHSAQQIGTACTEPQYAWRKQPWTACM